MIWCHSNQKPEYERSGVIWREKYGSRENYLTRRACFVCDNDLRTRTSFSLLSWLFKDSKGNDFHERVFDAILLAALLCSKNLFLSCLKIAAQTCTRRLDSYTQTTAMATTLSLYEQERLQRIKENQARMSKSPLVCVHHAFCFRLRRCPIEAATMRMPCPSSCLVASNKGIVAPLIGSYAYFDLIQQP
jgi:hypothetical protein